MSEEKDKEEECSCPYCTQMNNAAGAVMITLKCYKGLDSPAKLRILMNLTCQVLGTAPSNERAEYIAEFFEILSEEVPGFSHEYIKAPENKAGELN